MKLKALDFSVKGSLQALLADEPHPGRVANAGQGADEHYAGRKLWC